jgi:hypothetical protein
MVCVVGIIALLWIYLRQTKRGGKKAAVGANSQDEIQDEVHDKARLALEKAVGENVTFIQQDVRRSTSELNEYMQKKIARVIDEELAQYKGSAQQVRQKTLSSISKAQDEIAEQYKLFTSQLDSQLAAEKQRLIDRLHENMTDIVEHYIVAAVGDRFDIDQQMGYIIAELEANKDAINKDIRNGA